MTYQRTSSIDMAAVDHWPVSILFNTRKELSGSGTTLGISTFHVVNYRVFIILWHGKSLFALFCSFLIFVFLGSKIVNWA